jgi:hypothetical protein
MNRERIQKINDLIKKIKDKDILKEIFYIVQSDSNSNYSHNNNGIFFDLTILMPITLEKIEELVRNNITQTTTQTDSEILN